MKTFVIAEAGVNHNGKLKVAKKLIEQASICGASAIKFQIYNTNELVTHDAHKAKYQEKNLLSKISQHEMLKNYELKFIDFIEIKKHCIKNNIIFLASVFDLKSLEVFKKLKINKIKIPSGEITNYNLLKAIGKLNKEIIISSGMSKLKEIESAIKLLIKSGTKKNKITLLHCNSDYPTPVKDVNLKAMTMMKEYFKIKIGYSDHSNNIEVPIAAVTLGATIIEKHFTLNKKNYGPDHKASLEPKEFNEMIKNIKNTEILLGTIKKIISPSESQNIKYVRKSLVASKKINRGEIFKITNLSSKRPGDGISPMKITNILGKKAKKKFEKNEKIIV